MPVTIKRTVIVGLGGTGTRVLQYIKGEFQKHFPKGVPPAIRLISIDTAPQTTQAGAVGPIAALEANEFAHITATSIRRLLQTPEMQAWTPPLEKWDLSDVLNGAGQRRASGRLSLFRNAVSVYNVLNTQINQVKAIDLSGVMEDWPDFRVPEEQQTAVEVYVVGSLAGGTGSGMFLDIGYMIRDILKEEGADRVIGAFLLPGIFMKNLAAVDFVAGNGYASIKELDYWLDKLEEEEVHYPGGLSVKWGGALRKPYNFMYLLDDVNESGAVVTKLETMLYFVARGLFLHMTIQSNELTAFWSNLGGILQSADRWPEGHPNGKVPRYMSFGISSMQVPLERHIEQNIDEVLLERLGELRNSSFTLTPEKLEQDVKDFISNNRLESDALVDRLSPQDFRLEIPPSPERPWAKTGDIVPWKQQAITAIEEQLRRGVGEHTQTFATLEADASGTLIDHVYRIAMNQPGHVKQAELFVERLAVYLKELQTNVKNSETKREQQISAVAFAPLESALGGLFTRRKIEKLVSDYRQSLDNLTKLKLQQELHHLAAVLLGSLIIQVGKIQDELKEFDRHLERVMLRLRVDLDQLERWQAPGMDAFATILREEEVASAFIEKRPAIALDTLERAWHDSSASYAQERTEKGLFNSRTIFGWRTRSPEELADWLKREVRKSYKDLAEQSLDGIVHRLWHESEKSGTDVSKKLQQRLQEFMDKARPLWRVEVDPSRHLQYLLLIGIHERPDAAVSFIRSLIENGTIVTAGATQESFRSLHYASTWEQFAIRALRIGVPSPAYALNKMRTYRQEYLKREGNPQSRVTHHIHRAWMLPDSLPDLFPEGLDRPLGA